MKQFISLISDSEFVFGKECHEKDFYDYNLLFDKVYKDLTKPGVKKWQIFSVSQPDNNDTKLSMVFRSSNLVNALVETHPIIKAATNRETKLRSKLVMLDPPGRKEIKQVELYTKYRKYVPLQWQDETCPRPAEAVLEKFKLEKNEKVKSALEKKKDKQTEYYKSMAKRALTVAIFKTSGQTELPQAVAQGITNDVLVLTNNNEEDDTPNVYEA